MAYLITNGLCSVWDVKSALRIPDDDGTDDDRISLAIDSASRLIETKCNRRFWQDSTPRTDAGCVLNGTNVVTDTGVSPTDIGRAVSGNLVQAGSVIGSIVEGTSFTLVSYDGAALPATGSGTEALTIGLVPRRFVSNDPWLVEVDDIASLNGLIVQSDYAGDGTFGTTWEVQDYQLEPVNGLYGGQLWPFTKIRAIRSLYFPVWGGISYPKPYTQALVQVTAQWGWPSVPTDVAQAAVIQAIAIFKASDAPFGATPFAETGILRVKSDLHPTAALLLTPYREDPVLIA